MFYDVFWVKSSNLRFVKMRQTPDGDDFTVKGCPTQTNSPGTQHGTWKSRIRKGKTSSKPPVLGSMLVFWGGTWRIISVRKCTWLVTPICDPFRQFGTGTTLPLTDLRSPWYLVFTTYPKSDNPPTSLIRFSTSIFGTWNSCSMIQMMLNDYKSLTIIHATNLRHLQCSQLLSFYQV